MYMILSLHHKTNKKTFFPEEQALASNLGRTTNTIDVGARCTIESTADDTRFRIGMQPSPASSNCTPFSSIVLLWWSPPLVFRWYSFLFVLSLDGLLPSHDTALLRPPLRL